jgi:hypothetical protein
MKYYKIITLALFMYLVSSCKDFLNQESPSIFTETTIFKNVDFADKAVLSCYNSFCSVYAFGRYYPFHLADADIEFSTGANSSWNYAIAHYAATEGTTSLDQTWKAFYTAIERANICIDGLPKSPIWEGKYASDARRLYGDAVTMRAMCYYYLISVFGDVPLFLKATQGDSDFYLPKTDRDSIYEYLIDELKEVEDYVPWMQTTLTTERVNKAFVKGLRARMALAYAGYSLRNKSFETRRGRYWQEYYQIARQECLEVMESGKHQLNPSFESIFKNMCKYTKELTYKESLFELAFGKFDIGYMGTFFFGTSHSSSDPKYGYGGSYLFASPAYYYSFDRQDVRRDATCALFSYNSSAFLGKQVLISNDGYSYWMPAKFRKEWIEPLMGGQNTNGTGVNRPLMRFSDIILMFAEAENQLNGPTQAAKDALAQVRKRAFPEAAWPKKVGQYIDSVSVSKQSFFNAIVNERAWEFGGEQTRKLDLVRWNLLGPKIREMKEEWIKIVNDDPKYAQLVPDYVFWKRSEKNDEFIEILNPDYRMSETSVAGYTRAAWLSKMSATAKSTLFDQKISLIANGYNEAKNNHLAPIHVGIISTSNGTLSNDQIP